MIANYKNIVKCEQAGVARLIAFSRITGEQCEVHSSKLSRLMRASNAAILDKSGTPMGLRITPEVEIKEVEIVD